MLLFRSEETVTRWCEAHGVPKRPIINLDQLWYLAVTWYENRLTVDSRRPGPEEMVAIFARIGLDGPFWDPKADQWQSAIQIRMAVSNDVSSIASVLYESFIEYKSSYTHEGFMATTPTSDQILSRMNEEPVWVALYNDSIVGTVSAVPKGDEALYIRSMAILPAARGQGIGELLLKHVESFASAHGYKWLFLSTTPFLTRAIRLYEHFGFRGSVEGPHDLFGTPLFTMVKTLELSD